MARMKLMLKGATEKGQAKAAKRSDLFKKTRAKRDGLAAALVDVPLEPYEEEIVARSHRRGKKTK